jgi:hypothetical protein
MKKLEYIKNPMTMELEELENRIASHIPTNKAVKVQSTFRKDGSRVVETTKIQKVHSIGSNASQFVSDINYQERWPQLKTMNGKPIEEMSMSEIQTANPTFFEVQEKDTSDLTYLNSVSKPSSTAFIPAKDQVYKFIPKDNDANSGYWLKWENKWSGVVFCDYRNLDIKRLVVSATTKGLPFIHEIQEVSFGRFADICNSHPSISQLFQAYKLVQLEPIELEQITFDINNAVPIF